MRIVYCLYRLTDSSYSVAGHAADARQRSAAVLLRVLYLRHHRRSTVVRSAAEPLLSRPARKHLSRRHVSRHSLTHSLDASCLFEFRRVSIESHLPVPYIYSAHAVVALW